MDGPAFHEARSGIDELRRRGGSSFQVSCHSTGLSRWIKPFLDIISDESNGWNKNRLAILQRLLNNCDPHKISRATSLSIRAVYKNIQAASLKNVVVLLRLIEEELNQCIASP